MKTRGFILLVILGVTLNSSFAETIDLKHAYQQAITSDPTFKAAHSQWLADREILNIKRSTLLPHLGGQITLSKTNTKTNYPQTPAETTTINNVVGYQLQLNQSLFDFGKWATLWQAKALVKQAEVTFLAAIENLLLRTATTYLQVLQAQDVLSYAQANKESLARILKQNKHKYEVGLIAITDLENARASHDQAVAEEIAAANTLADRREKLREITGVYYPSLASSKRIFPLLTPQPANIERWVQVAEQQNFELAAARYLTIVAKENIKIQNAGHLPTLGASGSYKYGDQGINGSDNNLRQKEASGTLILNIPLLQGGQVYSATKQANYQYQKALAEQEIKHRAIIRATRQAYLGVISSISQIKANSQAIRSAHSSLRATKASYEAGTRTMTDVLQAQAALYENQKNLATSQYEYIVNLLKLKECAGILDSNDIAEINSWLTHTNSTTNSRSPIKRQPSPLKTPRSNRTQQKKAKLASKRAKLARGNQKLQQKTGAKTGVLHPQKLGTN